MFLFQIPSLMKLILSIFELKILVLGIYYFSVISSNTTDKSKKIEDCIRHKFFLHLIPLNEFLTDLVIRPEIFSKRNLFLLVHHQTSEIKKNIYF